MDFLNKMIHKSKESHQQNLIQYQNKRSHQILKNRLFLTSLINLLIFLIFVFSMCYYRWGKIFIPVYQIKQSQRGKAVEGQISIFFNLLYGKQVDKSYYQTYGQLEDEICAQNDLYCSSAFQQLMCIGYITFTIMIIGSTIQVFDIYKMIHYFFEGVDFNQQKKDNLRHIITIGHFVVGITLNVFGLVQMEVQVQLGASFWTFVSGISIFIIIIIYQQISLSNMRKQKMILNIMEKQRVASGKMNDRRVTIELSVESDTFI